MPLRSGARLGPYEILSPLGAGGMGEVYRARDQRLGRDVAIKVLPPEFTEDPERLTRFEREARATAALSHPNILAIYDVGRHDGVPYLVEELLEGESLKDRLDRGALPVPEAMRIATDMAKGLAAAHEKGLVHRDLKPGNVFLTGDGTIKLLDFGLAKRLPRASEAGETLTEAATAMTAAGGALGTMAYMAPEQLRGQRVDQRADVFAFGVVLYELLAGQRPFRGATATDTVVAILESTPAPLPAAVPAALATVVARCLEKDPERRYQRGSEVRAALEAVQSGSVVPGPSWLTRRRLRRALAATALLTVAVAAAIGLDLGGVRSRLFGPAPPTAIRLAVLPFANLSGDPEQEYLSDGLTQEMIAQLGRLHPETLSVIARTSVMRYKNTGTPIDQIGRELDVDYVLEASTQKEGSRVRITAELIKVRDQSQLWADRFDRELSGILALQGDVARELADALALRLFPAEQTRLASTRPVDPDAYEAYLKGSQHLIRLTPGDVDTAEGYFNLALEKDPDFAPAHAGMAWVWVGRTQMGIAPPGELVPRAREAAQTAIGLDDTLAEAYYALAAIKSSYEWDHQAAGLMYQRAIALDPNNVKGLAAYSHFLAITGHVDEALTEIDRAASLDPLNVVVRGFRAIDLLFARRYDEAIAEARKTLAMQSNSQLALNTLYTAFHATGQFDEAIAAAVRVYDEWLPGAGAVLEKAYAEGDYAGAWRALFEFEVANHGDKPGLAFDIAFNSAMIGDTARALEWLEMAYDRHDAGLPYINANPAFDSLRSEPRFQALLRRLNLPVE